VSDRFADSTRAYQGVVGKLDRRFILALERIAIANVRPDLTFFLDIPAEAGLLRISNRRKGEPADRFEAEGIQFHSDLRNAFREIAEAEPERCATVNALAPEDEVAATIWSEVETRLLGGASKKLRRARRKQVTEKRA
jgi:dTMP kinase